MDKWLHPTHYNGCNYLSMLVKVATSILGHLQVWWWLNSGLIQSIQNHIEMIYSDWYRQWNAVTRNKLRNSLHFQCHRIFGDFFNEITWSPYVITNGLGLYSLSGKTSCHKASWSLEALKFEFIISNRSEIWQPHRQQCYRDACQISERYDHCNIQSRGFETSRDLAVRRLTV